MWLISSLVLNLEPPTQSLSHLPYTKGCVAPPQPLLNAVPSSPPASLGIFLAFLTPPPLLYFMVFKEEPLPWHRWAQPIASLEREMLPQQPKF